MASSLDLSRTYTSFSGVDIKVVIDGNVAGTMQAVSYAIQREKAPIYVMGKVDPLSFSRGKRGIAGTMISIMLDQHMIWREPWATGANVVLDKDEIIPSEWDMSLGLDQSIDKFAGIQAANGSAPPGIDDALTGSLSDGWEARGANYVDQIAPFDISIIAVNEYGKAAMMRIYGCEILNEGSGFSIDDIVIENQMTYICRTILPWKSMGGWKTDGSTINGPYGVGTASNNGTSYDQGTS
jgi:hypothetical protein